MSMDYIRRYYKVPAKRGMRIKFCGQPAVITSTTRAYLRIRVDGDDFSIVVHPTWEIEYPEVSDR